MGVREAFSPNGRGRRERGEHVSRGYSEDLGRRLCCLGADNFVTEMSFSAAQSEVILSWRIRFANFWNCFQLRLLQERPNISIASLLNSGENLVAMKLLNCGPRRL